MKIVEIGHSGVGKTTYMASLYGALQKSIEGFTLQACADFDHLRLLELANAIKSGRYPAPTDQRSEYNFNLRYQGRNVFPFHWADYRGEAIRQSTKSSEQARLLIQDLRQADGIMMFCDAYALYRGDVLSNQLGRMISLVTNAISQGLNHPISLAIVLTKIDLVPEIDEERLITPFDGLISVIQASELVSGMIIPVACGIEPYNVEKPLLFALQSGVYMQLAQLEKEIEEHREMAKHYEQQTYGFVGFFREMASGIQGNVTNREMSQTKLMQAIARYQEFESLIEPVTALQQYLSN